MLILKNVCFTRPHFDLDISFTLDPGERIAIMGHSGCGKSTLLSLMAGLLAPSCGEMIWSGKSLLKTRPALRPFAILFQEYNLFPHLSVFDNVALGLSTSIKKANKDTVMNTLERMKIEHLAHRFPQSLSGGEKQRTALARTLLMKRPILLLDEPFQGLGPELKYELLSHIPPDTSIILTTHHPEEARALSERTLFMNHGKIIQGCSTSCILKAPNKDLDPMNSKVY